jgi:CubicO group peptidase (beta-lactamase class C family)
VAHLLTHTPGYDDFYIGKSSRTEKEALPLGEFLKKHLPERITEPGEVFMYSNMGMALAAFLVEEITGKDFEQYAIENLFIPLDMNKSSFRVKKLHETDIYKGYVYLNGKQNEFPFDFINDYPAGQMLTTINEFSNFMIMHLNRGIFDRKIILDSLIVDEMQSVQFTHHPKLNSAFGYGFQIDKYSEMKMLSHGGGYPGIQTYMKLFPELKLGIFIAHNGYNSSLNEIVLNEIMNKFFPYTDSISLVKYPLTELPAYDKDIDKFVGNYRFTRYSRNEISKIGLLIGMIGGELPIWKNDKGMLLMYDLSGKERRLIQIEPLLFQSIDDDYYIKFREDKDGNITHLFTDGITSLEKVQLVYTIKFQKTVFAVITIVFVLISFTGLFIGVIKKIRRKEEKKSALFKLAEKISNTYLVYLLLFGLAMNVFLNPLEQMVGFPYGMPWYFYLFQMIPFALIGLTVLFVFKFLTEIKNKATLKFSIIFNVLFMAVCFTAIWFLNTWNLIGFKF